MSVASRRHRNCFYYFRGPGSKSHDGDVDRQLEDNCTKALINVLEHGGPALTRRFIASFAGVDIDDSRAQFRYFLQAGPDDPAPRRVLLGIAEFAEIDPSSWEQDGAPTGSRVDATIDAPGQLTVLVETKIVPRLDGAQLLRHAERWGLSLPSPRLKEDEPLPADWVLARWDDVHRWALGESEAISTQPAQFLLGQLTEFLELAGLAATWRLEPEHFDYFRLPASGRDPLVKLEIRTRLHSLWAAVEAELGRAEFEHVLGVVRVGTIPASADHAFAQSNSDSGSDLVNLTIEIYGDEVCVNVVGWFDAQRDALLGWLRGADAQAFFDGHPDHELVAFVRRGKPTKSGRVMWKGALGEMYSRFSMDAGVASVLDQLGELERRLDPKTEKLSLHLRRSWPEGRAVEVGDLAGQIAAAVRAFVPVLHQARGDEIADGRVPVRRRGTAEARRVPDDSISQRIRGCLLGGAVGDALGEPVEFMSLTQIRESFGPDGIKDYAGSSGHISDDTQMTLFTAEGLIRAELRAIGKGICHPPSVIGHAYLRWLHTQGEASTNPLFVPDHFDGWLVEVAGLHQRRAPGNTCVTALGGTEFGSMDRPLNDSKGCGGVMRAAPVGLSRITDPFEVGCEVAAITHGHPSGYLSAGFLALVIRRVVREGGSLERAVELATERLRSHANGRECLDSVTAAVDAAAGLGSDPSASQAAGAIGRLGQGWVAEEALSIALFCALGSCDFEQGVRWAVNHGGDSDSTGAIAGNILGAVHGVDAIPQGWIDRLDLGDVVGRVAVDMCNPLYSDAEVAAMFERYPGW